MTEEFAQKQIADLQIYLATINANYDELKSQLGEVWVEKKVHAILDDLHYYKDFLAQEK